MSPPYIRGRGRSALPPVRQSAFFIAVFLIAVFTVPAPALAIEAACADIGFHAEDAIVKKLLVKTFADPKGSPNKTIGRLAARLADEIAAQSSGGAAGAADCADALAEVAKKRWRGYAKNKRKKLRKQKAEAQRLENQRAERQAEIEAQKAAQETRKMAARDKERKAKQAALAKQRHGQKKHDKPPAGGAGKSADQIELDKMRAELEALRKEKAERESQAEKQRLQGELEKLKREKKAAQQATLEQGKAPGKIQADKGRLEKAPVKPAPPVGNQPSGPQGGAGFIKQYAGENTFKFLGRARVQAFLKEKIGAGGLDTLNDLSFGSRRTGLVDGRYLTGGGCAKQHCDVGGARFVIDTGSGEVWAFVMSEQTVRAIANPDSDLPWSVAGGLEPWFAQRKLRWENRRLVQANLPPQAPQILPRTKPPPITRKK